MKNSKTFRLFISSTFNDFREEREVLQTKVFPIIKKYYSEKGYRFQPIDLRWGINNEAQLDQKTLELCLDEVKTCKSYPNPNFLVMLGDRYGWIPLPYIIEQNEFEEILRFTDDKGESLLKEWYQLDKNQLPASYILKQREGKFKLIENWNIVENTLLKILQNNSNKASLTTGQKRKYFTSATEAEIEEGIIPYPILTAHQSKLLKGNLNLEKEDTEYIFGFFRNVEINSTCSEKFITDDFEKAQKLKTKVKEVLLNENVLECNTAQINESDLNQSYLDSFENKVISFLKQKLENQINKETKFTKLEIEKQEQAYFAKQKRQNFIGQEKILQAINDYLENDNQQAFVLYGKSGSGKSSIIAKAISEVKEKPKVIYRFVGATSNSSSSTTILISVFNELGITIERRADIKTDFTSKNENFEEFSNRIKNEFLLLNTNAIIFIDAVDQLTNSDQFLWLPTVLPKNMKIIISALDDTNYKTDSTYFKRLKEITSNIHFVKPFDLPEKLLLNLLRKENRTLQQHQLNYFLKQYNNSKTPLYVYVASQEIKHWKSSDLTEGQTPIENHRTQNLAISQKGVIEEFINNLSVFFHHDKEFVQKVLAYIYASRDGLSENELLELLNTDKEFIQKVAPETWHKNTNKELPLVIWSRLYTHLKPFLSKKNQDNEELLFFFHREFVDALGNDSKTRIGHEQLLESGILLIKSSQSLGFSATRWGKLFSTSLYLYLSKGYQSNVGIKYEHPYLYHSWFTKLNNSNLLYIKDIVEWNLKQWDFFTKKNSYNIEIAYLILKSSDRSIHINLYLKTVRDLILVFLLRKTINYAFGFIAELEELNDSNKLSIGLDNIWFNRNVISKFYYNLMKQPYHYNRYKEQYLDNNYKKLLITEELYSKNSTQYLNNINEILSFKKDRKLEEEKLKILTQNSINSQDNLEQLKTINKQLELKKQIPYEKVIKLFELSKTLTISLHKKQSNEFIELLYSHISFENYNDKKKKEIILREELEIIFKLKYNATVPEKRLKNLHKLIELLIATNNQQDINSHLEFLHRYYHKIIKKDFKSYIKFINHYFKFVYSTKSDIKDYNEIFDTITKLSKANPKKWLGHYLKFINNLIDNFEIINCSISLYDLQILKVNLIKRRNN